MLEKLALVERRFIYIEDSLGKPNLEGKELVTLTKERAELEPVVLGYRHYCSILEEITQTQILLADPEIEGDMKLLAREELISLEEQRDRAHESLIVLMLPKDPLDKKNVILEIRAGTGGDEAALFVADLYRMYTRHGDKKGWTFEVMSLAEGTMGGLKEVICSISGDKVYSRLKFEMGAHRVQRIPATESQGRIHTSACTVAILPEVEEIEVHINPADLRFDTYRSSGAGGQHINTTDSAVRVTHIPSGIVAECQEERSQHKNREKALKMLRSRIFEKNQKDQMDALSADRKKQVGSGDRSERIRTYNFPQGRMTDHRINLTLYKLAEIMEGDLDEVLDALGAHHTAELLKANGDFL
jgi:peptide chain release factor 1